MAHEDIYIEDANNCFTIGDWFEYYASQSTPIVPLRYAYATLKKTQITNYDNGTDQWKKTQIWHWSYFWILDWMYPSYGIWTNEWHDTPTGKRSVSGSSGGRVEGDASAIPREKLASLSSDADVTKVDLNLPRITINSSNYTLFGANNGYKYEYQPSELSPSNYEVAKKDVYEYEYSIDENRGDTWSLNSQGRLTLPEIHSEVLPNTDTLMPTEWRLDENGHLTMPVLREVVNNLGAFSDCSNLKTLLLPNSVETLGKKSCIDTSLSSIEIPNDCDYYDTTFPENCVVNGGDLIVTPKPLRRRYTYTVNEISSGTSLTTSVKCSIGDLVVATIAIRGNTYSLSDGWTLIGISEATTLNQRTALVYKIATSLTETLTVEQDTEARIYTNLVAITGGQLGEFSGFTTLATGKTITATKPSGLVLWAVSSAYWSTSTPYPVWSVSNESYNTLLQLPNSTQPRCLTALDQSASGNVTFTSPSNDAGLACASLTITGITDFCF